MKLIKFVFILLGFISMTVGIIGIAVPVLPTTPFILLASYFFMRGSDRFDRWFRTTKVFKDYAEDFIRDRSMTLKRKVKLMFISDFMLAFPLIILKSIYMRLFILLVVVSKYYYFFFVIKTKKEE
ncbi:MAG: YbaN family protein [Tissierellaceae bacterium]|nr:YbaN family protein [Tissierellaceae bacterium]